MTAAHPDGPPVRTAMVGLGWATRSIWLPRLRRHPGFVVSAAVDPDPASRAAFRADSPDTPVLAAVHETDPSQVDLAIVAVPNHLHCEIATGLLLKGVPVFLEKPVCLTSAEAEQLAEAERVGGARLLAGSAACHRADVRALLETADDLGDVRHIELSWVRARGVPDAGGWFTQRQLSGGGALVDLGWHLFDIAAPLLGSADFTRVAGAVSGDFIARDTARVSWRAEETERSAAEEVIDVEDTARAFLVTNDGISVSLHVSWASHEERDITRVRVDGSAGSATMRCTFGFSPNRLERPELTRTDDGRTRVVPVPDEPIGTEYDRQLDALLSQLRDPSGARRAIEETRRTIGAIERIYSSARAVPAQVPRPKPSLHEGEHHSAMSSLGTDHGPAVPDARAHPAEPVDAVVFDLDGVLVNSFAVMRQAFTTAYAEVVGEGEPPFEEYERHLGRYFPDIMRIMGLPLEMEAPFVRESYRLAHLVEVFDGVPELLRELRARGVQLAVATGKSGPRARSLLQQLGLLDLFTVVIGSDEVARPKPAPDIVLKAMGVLRSVPSRTVMVGDAVTDLDSARGAGVAAVAALWGETDGTTLLAEKPDVLLHTPAELLEVCVGGSRTP